MGKHRQKMLPVVEREGLSILQPTHDKAVIGGGGDWDYTCAHCDKVLAENVAKNPTSNWLTPAPEGIVIRCHKCGKLSSFPR